MKKSTAKDAKAAKKAKSAALWGALRDANSRTSCVQSAAHSAAPENWRTWSGTS